MIKPIAIYLPQFHPTPENDEWWGKGFTEWTNVTKAQPYFKEHYQPQLPTDFGYYDLRCIDNIEDQANTARAHGIHGFSFYHYWFKGKRILHEPIDLILQTKKPDFPFLLFWANETWSRRWLGEEKEILIKQAYSDEDDIAHATWLFDQVFSDDRYIKIEGKPVFVIYRPSDFPDYKKTLRTFRKVAEEKGYPGIYLVHSNSHHDMKLEGFDHVLNFEPQLGLLPEAFKDDFSIKRWVRNASLGVQSGTLKVYDYDQVKNLMHKRSSKNDYIPCIFVGWDNTARRNEKGIIIINQNVAAFKKSLLQAKDKVIEGTNSDQFIFINAWNEWAEGNHLEPCQKFGLQFLQAVKEVFVSN